MSERARDDETKQFNQEYTDEDFLNAVRDCPVASTGKVANAVGCNRKTALLRLKQLEGDGEIDYEKVSGKARVWFIVDE